MPDRISQAKRDMREAMMARRRLLQEQAPDAGARVDGHFRDHVVVELGAIVSGYHPMGSELDCLPLMSALAETATTCLPVVAGTQKPLNFRVWRPGEPLEPAGFGTQVPAAEASGITPSVLLVPLLAFDARGYRLGYGGGFYDRTLAQLGTAKVLAVGLAFGGQQVEEVPTGRFDLPLDAVVTEDGLAVDLRRG